MKGLKNPLKYSIRQLAKLPSYVGLEAQTHPNTKESALVINTLATMKNMFNEISIQL